ncbi:hypothetical protein QEN19_000923 [Hanseniaspora menglaensis]
MPNKRMLDTGLSRRLNNNKKVKVEVISHSLQNQYDQKKILSKLEETKNLLKEIEEDFDDEEFFNLSSNKKAVYKSPQTTKFVELSTTQLNNLSELEKINYELQKNAAKFEKDQKKSDDLNFFLAEKQEEERMDTIRKLQEPDMIMHDLMGYDPFFNLPFIKFDVGKLKSILNVNTLSKAKITDIENFLFQKQDSEGNWLHNYYNDDDLRLSFEEKKKIWIVFEKWLINLTEVKQYNTKTILLKSVTLLHVLFIFSIDFYHNNMMHQNTFNECFDISNSFDYLKTAVPLIYEKLNTITNQELDEMNFFKSFLNSNIVNDYHIQLFIQLDKLPVNIIERFKEYYYYANQFEDFIRNTVILNSNAKNYEKVQNNDSLLSENNVGIVENRNSSLVKHSLESIKSCEQIEESNLLGIVRCIKIKNYFIKKKKNLDLFKEVSFLLSLIGCNETKYYKKLAGWVREEIRKMSANKDEFSTLKVLNSAATLIKDSKNGCDSLENDGDSDNESTTNDEDENIKNDEKENVNYYGFSKHSLSDVFLRRYLESVLITIPIFEKEIQDLRLDVKENKQDEFVAEFL